MRFLLAVTLLFGAALAQNRPGPFDAAKGHTSYSFPVRPAGEPFRFQVQLDKTGTITGLAVFRPGDPAPSQVLPSCEPLLLRPLDEWDEDRELVWHGDLNFDGFEDVGLWQFFHPHLGDTHYCMYLWSEKDGRFVAAPDPPMLEPVLHPKTKTFTTHKDWMGGIWVDNTYRWNGGKLEIVESSGRGSGSDDPNCHFTDRCEKLINGKMVTTLERPVACEDGREEPELLCPENATPGITKESRTPVPIPKPAPKPPPAQPPLVWSSSVVFCNDISGTWSDPNTGGEWKLSQNANQITGTLQIEHENCGTVTWQVTGTTDGKTATMTAANPQPAVDRCGIAAAAKMTATLEPGCQTGAGKVVQEKKR
jgi:hypothetical protein